MACIPHGPENLVGANVVALRRLSALRTRNNAGGLGVSGREVGHSSPTWCLIAFRLGNLMPEKLRILPRSR